MAKEVIEYCGHIFELSSNPEKFKWICKICKYSTGLLELFVSMKRPLSLTCNEYLIKKLLE